MFKRHPETLTTEEAEDYRSRTSRRIIELVQSLECLWLSVDHPTDERKKTDEPERTPREIVKSALGERLMSSPSQLKSVGRLMANEFETRIKAIIDAPDRKTATRLRNQFVGYVLERLDGFDMAYCPKQRKVVKWESMVRKSKPLEYIVDTKIKKNSKGAQRKGAPLIADARFPITRKIPRMIAKFIGRIEERAGDIRFTGDFAADEVFPLGVKDNRNHVMEEKMEPLGELLELMINSAYETQRIVNGKPTQKEIRKAEQLEEATPQF